jgi:hypothetical protein
MAEQGFEHGTIAGESCSASWLLSRQSVVLGTSDGRIMARPPSTRPAQLRATMAPLPQDLFEGLKDLPLRSELPPGQLKQIGCHYFGLTLLLAF